jgi:2'-5' RNA ligase
MQKEQNPLILTLRLDPVSQAFFDELRARHFPPERNYLKAHLTLFHQLPQVAVTYDHLAQVRQVPFRLDVSGLKSLGAGVAYTIAGAAIFHLRESLAAYFRPVLIPQDLQGFRPHITIQNKVKPDQAKSLLAALSGDFQPFEITATGLDLWEYLDGPWRHSFSYDFEKR